MQIMNANQDSIKVTSTAELLNKLSPDNLATVADLVAMFADQPANGEAAPPAPQPQTPVEPPETAKTGEFEAVATIGRHVLAKLLVGSFGAKILDFENDLSEFQNVWFDITDGIKSALPLTDAAELHKAAVYFSVSH